MPQGLILVCGKTGQGKSTTLASLLQHRANKFKEHIVTLEQPIEYILRSTSSSISQRKIGVSSDSFASGLRAALRQSADAILVGEIRDRETAEIALSAAESGHIVFGTLHTSNAAQSIERFVNIFPTETQPAIWNVLSTALRAIICQSTSQGHRRASRGCEGDNDRHHSISSYIKKQDIQGVRRGMESGFKEYGMVNWGRAAEQLAQQGIIGEQIKKETNSTRRITCSATSLKILTFQPFRVRNDDPLIPFGKKVKGKHFTVAILGHQQIKYAKARFRNGALELMKTNTAFVDNFQNAEQDSAWAVDIITEAGDVRKLLIGINSMFSNLKIYSERRSLKGNRKGPGRRILRRKWASRTKSKPGTSITGRRANHPQRGRTGKNGEPGRKIPPLGF